MGVNNILYKERIIMEQQPINQQSPEAIAVVVSNLKNSEGKFNLDTSGFQPNTARHSTSHSNMILRQEPRTVKEYGADIGLPYETRLGMALMLDEYQCALHVAMHQYNKHHWMSEVAKSFVSLH